MVLETCALSWLLFKGELTKNEKKKTKERLSI
jgi:hypothetical protein